MKKIILSLAALICFATYAQAQTKVTFQIDMKYALQNGLFNQYTQAVMLKGDKSPLGNGVLQHIKLEDTAPIDSIYSAVVEFPSIYNDKMLEYNFVIKKLLSSEQEDRVRQITLNGGEMELPAINFNSYDW